MFTTSSVSRAICFSMFIALSTQAAQVSEGGSASIGDFKVTCGSGLLPLVLDGDLKGAVEVPLGKVSFSGRRVRLGYCGYPVVGSNPSLVNTGRRTAGADPTSFVTSRNGFQLSCLNGELPFVLKGSAEGSLSTSKGVVSLHGDHNDVAVCLRTV
ncbi:hypothetical protein GTP58_21455 [Duganella sp. CY15W]|uniref:hypothetical protein n=1 Tax=Duganella sp. CY15W TaxID=2692172 RepID=UPI00136EC49A|nr:hypothetical protein [Duganella sp. CY15W]MYM30907.1 hypothetical protein [Duganella sp. CY15W]